MDFDSKSCEFDDIEVFYESYLEYMQVKHQMLYNYMFI